MVKTQLLKEIDALRDKKGFIRAGLPRFDRLFGRDSLIVAWQLLGINPLIAKNTLAVLAEFQGKTVNSQTEEEPGKILHEEKGYFPYNYYGSVDSTPLFLILFGFYFRKTRDLNFVKKYWEEIEKAVSWIIDYGDKDKDGFVEYERKNPRGLFHQAWKDGFDDHLKITPPVAIIEVQGYVYLALKETAKLARIIGKLDFSRDLNKRAKDLKQKFNETFWLKDKKYFCLGLDKNKRQKTSITSNPGHLLFTGILDREKAKSVISRLFGKDLWTSFGVRNHSALEPDFDPKSYHLGSVWPHDNWIIAQGLKRLGYKKEYRKIKTSLSAAYKKIGFLPEFYGVTDGGLTIEMKRKPCYPQAWASAALLNLLSTR